MNTTFDHNLSDSEPQISSNFDDLPDSDRENIEAIRESWLDISQWEPGQQEYGDPAFGQDLGTDEKPILENPYELPDEAQESAFAEGKTLKSEDVTQTAEFDGIEPFPPPTETVEECGNNLHDAGVQYDSIDGPG